MLAGAALAQQQRIDPKDLKAPPKLPAMAAPSNIAGSVKEIDQQNVLVLDLSTGGRVRIVMRPDVAPNHIMRVKTLVREGFYDGTIFHRVIDGFMAQGGDPTGTGTGGSKLEDLKAEFNDLPHVRGAVAMARAASNDSANSQFYIVLMPVMKLDRTYTIWGRVIEGMEFVDAIAKGEPPENPSRILKASIGADNVAAPDFAALAAAPVATPIPAGALALPPGVTLPMPAAALAPAPGAAKAPVKAAAKAPAKAAPRRKR
ncbi:peptidylprolyl isomerase [Sandarakinorhabdus sp.]|uniref:peptidylprolyl isomerase n=1 Tax=Sandarakinorhabdus sp. TaxID=1916663 RepID=UPI00286DA3EA|nr:peptidylprolyl isomerase [Sandarakinorhabdus sp.]